MAIRKTRKFSEQEISWDPIIAKLIERAQIGNLLKHNGNSEHTINELWNWYDYPEKQRIDSC